MLFPDQRNNRDTNFEIAGLLYDLAELHRPAPQSMGYKRAARTVRAYPYALSRLTETEILAIPSIGPATYRVIREFLAEGRAPSVDRAIEHSDKKQAVAQRRVLRENFMSYARALNVLGGADGETDDSETGMRPAVRREDYGGDFQMHSLGSDGSDTLDAMVEACVARGYRCACITDHSHGLRIANGMSRQSLARQGREIRSLNARLEGTFRLFRGAEANIQTDGSLDLDEAERRELELVVASPHSSLRKAHDQTERMLAAVALPGVHILGHPRGRVFNMRAGIVADWPAVFHRAAETGVAIEIDGDASRQDIDHTLATLALGAGCIFALDSDAHATDQLWMSDYALAHARLAGIPADRIINCWEPGRILAWAAAAWEIDARRS